MTENATVKAGDGVTYTRAELKALVDTVGSFRPERIDGPIIIEVDLPVLSPGWMVADVGTAAGFNEMGLIKVVEEDGTLLIAYHETWRGGQKPALNHHRHNPEPG
jgi:hypothetical protein